MEESTGSFRSRSPNVATQNGKLFRSSSIGEVVCASDFTASGSKCDIGVNGNLLHKHNDADVKLLADDKYDVCCSHLDTISK